MKNTSIDINTPLIFNDLSFNKNRTESFFFDTKFSHELVFNTIHNLILISLPEKNQSSHIVTRNAINAYDFIRKILEYEKIIELYIVIYRIGKKTLQDLCEKINKNQITNVTILINDGFEKLNPEVFSILSKMANIKFKIENNHTKIILAKTKEDFYIIEGSGNLSINARIEQYCFINSKGLYDFHKKWIDEISTRE